MILLCSIPINKSNSQFIMGSLVSLLSASVGFTLNQLISHFINNSGSTIIYIKHVYSKINGKPWGFLELNNVKTFQVPLWIELQNTKNVNTIFRDINLHLYYKNKEVGTTKQVSDINENIFGIDGNYSIIVKPNSIIRIKTQFVIKKNTFNNSFDEVRLGYFNMKDKYKEFKILTIDNCWQIQTHKLNDAWKRIE